MKTILKIIGGFLLTCIILIGVALVVINTDYVQNKALQYYTTKLSNKLKTKVEAERISINFFKLTLDLHEVETVIHGKKSDNTFHVKAMHIRGERVELEGLRLITDNHKPRKNEGKPKRGWFDAGHLDITANLKLRVNYLDADTINISITKGNAIDSISGFNITDLRMHVASDLKNLYVSDAVIQQGNTVIQIPGVEMQIPSKKKGIGLTFHTTEPLTANVILQDISRLFTPALAEFTMPLKLSADVSGTDSTMVFNNILVTNEDEMLKITASGGIDHLKNKYLLNICFHVDEMIAKSGIKHRIIEQFPVKKFMMESLSNLGDISYTGDFSILRKREVFSGRIGTGVGNIDLANLTLNDSTKYLSGSVSTKGLDLGKALNTADLGNIITNASFEFDYSKERTAEMRKQLGGKLPIGNVAAKVDEASYKKVMFRNVTLTLESNGAVADGQVIVSNRLLDSKFNFTFTDTNEMQKMKVKPGVKIKNPLTKLFSKKKK